MQKVSCATNQGRGFHLLPQDVSEKAMHNSILLISNSTKMMIVVYNNIN